MHIRRRLTFANVMSTIAVFIALGGTGYAVTSLPKDSVGAKQIRTGAVRSKEVKDRSLETRDFAPGQFPGGRPPPGARAWGLVSKAGALQLTRSRNVVRVEHKPGSGFYCIVPVPQIDPKRTALVATPDVQQSSTSYSGPDVRDDDTTIVEVAPRALGCADGIQVETGYQSFEDGVFKGNVFTEEGFFFVIP
ncbi:MAG: hypothetical protein QOG41_260 [Thermoleophilaceae bacterium]|jgi:hypothetical protein|nr:hypothetical protein [Thermoleophilaceae bacterium]